MVTCYFILFFVDKVDNFVDNSILRAFSVTYYVDKFVNECQ